MVGQVMFELMRKPQFVYLEPNHISTWQWKDWFAVICGIVQRNNLFGNRMQWNKCLYIGFLTICSYVLSAVYVKKRYEEMINIAYSSSEEYFLNKTKWNLKDIECAINKYYKDDHTKLLVFNKLTLKLKWTIDYINSKHSIASY